MTRQQANLKIAELLKGTELETKYYLGTDFEFVAEQKPEQRAGQIICNYICCDYRSANPAYSTVEILSTLFPDNPDPFFEESTVTLRRLKELCKR